MTAEAGGVDPGVQVASAAGTQSEATISNKSPLSQKPRFSTPEKYRKKNIKIGSGRPDK